MKTKLCFDTNWNKIFSLLAFVSFLWVSVSFAFSFFPPKSDPIGALWDLGQDYGKGHFRAFIFSMVKYSVTTSVTFVFSLDLADPLFKIQSNICDKYSSAKTVTEMTVNSLFYYVLVGFPLVA